MKSASCSFQKAKETLCTLSPLICVTTIIVTAFAVICVLNLHLPGWQGPALSPQYSPLLAAKLQASRIHWGTSLFVFYLAFIMLVATSIAVIWGALDAWHYTSKIGAIAGLLVVTVAACSLVHLELTSFPMVIALIKKHLGSSADVICLAARCGVAAVILATSAASFILFSPQQAAEARVVHMARQTTELRILLYIASLMLVAGIFEIKSLFTHLTAHFLPAENLENLNLLLAQAADEKLFKLLSGQAMIVKEIADATKMAAGAVFTALLAGMYLPAAVVLETRQTRLNAQLAAAAAGGQPAVPSAQPQTSPKAAIPAALTQMMNLVAALAPFVLGTSLDLLGKLTS